MGQVWRKKRLKMTKHMTIEEAFWSRVEKTFDCWLWLGQCDGSYDEAGYAIFWYRGERVGRAARYAYELLVKRLSKTLRLRRTCQTRGCVNPQHHVPMTYRELNRETVCAPKVFATHCIHGHAFTSDNTIFRKNGTRCCRKCSYMRDRIYRQRAA